MSTSDIGDEHRSSSRVQKRPPRTPDSLITATLPTILELATTVRANQAKGIPLGQIPAAEQLVTQLLEAWKHTFVVSKFPGRLCLMLHEREALQKGVFGALTERLLELDIDVTDLSLQIVV